MQKAHIKFASEGVQGTSQHSSRNVAKFECGPQGNKNGCFCKSQDAQEKLYLTEYNSAWAYDWGKLTQGNTILWANPPFDDLRKTVLKACLEPCRMVLVAPNWQKGDWKEILDRIKVKEIFYDASQPIFERNKDSTLLPGRHWGVKVYYFDTQKTPVQKGELDPVIVEEIENDSMGWGLEELEQNLLVGSNLYWNLPAQKNSRVLGKEKDPPTPDPLDPPATSSMGDPQV